MEWAATHLEGVKSHCKYHVQVNQPLPPAVLADPNFQNPFNDSNENDISTANTTVVPATHQPVVQQFSPAFLDKIKELSCLNECSGNGVCINGKKQYFRCSML